MVTTAVPTRDQAVADVERAVAARDRAVARVADLEGQVRAAREAMASTVERAGEALADLDASAGGPDARTLGADVARLRADLDVLEVGVSKARAAVTAANGAVDAARAVVDYVRVCETCDELEAWNWAFARLVGGVDVAYGEWLDACRAFEEARERATAGVSALEASGVTWTIPAPRVHPPSGLGQVVGHWRGHLIPEYRRSAARLVNGGALDEGGKRAPVIVPVDPVPYPEDLTTGGVPAGVVERVRRVLSGAPS